MLIKKYEMLMLNIKLYISKIFLVYNIIKCFKMLFKEIIRDMLKRFYNI